MSRKYKFKDKDALYFVSFAVINWIDLFIRNEYRNILLDSRRYCVANKGMELYSYCIMTSHVHMILGSHGESLEKIMQNMKRHTSVELKSAIKGHPGESRKEWMLWMMERAGKKNSNNANFQLWQQDNHPIQLLNPQMTHQKLDYIHNNPVVAGIVEKPEDYLYSSARDYYGTKGPIQITLLDPILV
jgi:REP element-mobilizing transposase RayT